MLSSPNTSTTKSYVNLAESPHSFRVRAVDSAGNKDDTPAERKWTITNAPTVDPTSLVPTDGQVSIQCNTPVSATFSEEMNSGTIDTNTFKLSQKHWYQVKKKGKKIRRVWMYAWLPVTATVSCNSSSSCTKATLTPSCLLAANTSLLAANTTYSATITTGVKDEVNNPMSQNHSWSFTTGSS